ncbi:kynurenine/alpha-aminoadipate aminotransferase, mitochondrial-like [Colletes gigas]|uniref:kynurenine/alpha-aminoadipate aminotransferase, mitochondrial-like n=1 Tax=Colletes gigas TaxID=935657 RepID=UPI001C9BB4D5|nr:kynurenine/alpha-aminoadipate aminotransferase, mitochondrial-like [Colletes gigas]
MDCARFITEVSGRRKTSMLRKTTNDFLERPNSINLANGMPNITTFPFEEISVTYKNGEKVKLVGDELSCSLQYGSSQGYKPLLKKIREHQKYWYEPKYTKWDVIVTSGSSDGCSMVFDMVVEPGDPIMIQEPVYNGTLSVLGPITSKLIGIPQDQNGIIPEEITKVLEERLRNKESMPKVLYVNPIGANPTGTVLPESRKKRIYELAQIYDFLIVEDDPYYFINFLDERSKTFLEYDTDGRVIRLDSFSKILSAGLRIGVVTAHEEFIKKLVMHNETTCIHPSSLSQMLVYKFLDMWDTQKLQQHFGDIQRFYRERRDIALASIQKHLTGLVEWNVPHGGMFIWMRVIDLEDVMEIAVKKCVSKGIFILPGHAFVLNPTKPEQHLRISYSYSTSEEIEKAISVLARVIREEIKEKSRNKSH